MNREHTIKILRLVYEFPKGYFESEYPYLSKQFEEEMDKAVRLFNWNYGHKTGLDRNQLRIIIPHEDDIIKDPMDLAVLIEETLDAYSNEFSEIKVAQPEGEPYAVFRATYQIGEQIEEGEVKLTYSEADGGIVAVGRPDPVLLGTFVYNICADRRMLLESGMLTR